MLFKNSLYSCSNVEVGSTVLPWNSENNALLLDLTTFIANRAVTFFVENRRVISKALFEGFFFGGGALFSEFTLSVGVWATDTDFRENLLY